MISLRAISRAGDNLSNGGAPKESDSSPPGVPFSPSSIVRDWASMIEASSEMGLRGDMMVNGLTALDYENRVCSWICMFEGHRDNSNHTIYEPMEEYGRLNNHLW